ncbi:MAG: hypothetical protein V2J65_21300 [Desulfobacteraceae bacterium]|jgi:hypothetical protein|nr:hypothetical protein [Desulfobacteraceae bacterium]
MKTKLQIAIMFGMLLVFSGPATAQMTHGGQGGNMPMNATMMHQHMHEMADLMSSMAETMHRGNMTPEQQVQCAGFMERMGAMMRDASTNTRPKDEEKRAAQLNELKEEWNYWKEQEEH